MKKILPISILLVIIIYSIIVNFANEKNWIILSFTLALTSVISSYSVWLIDFKSKKKYKLFISVFMSIFSIFFLLVAYASTVNIITGEKNYSGDCFVVYEQNNKGGGWVLKANNDSHININIKYREALYLTTQTQILAYLSMG